MTEELADLIAHFGGQSTHMQCLLHVENLVAKSITREFNVQTTTGNDDACRWYGGGRLADG